MIINLSQWATSAFIIPGKSGTIRFISDFRELNKREKIEAFSNS